MATNQTRGKWKNMFFLCIIREESSLHATIGLCSRILSVVEEGDTDNAPLSPRVSVSFLFPASSYL